MMESNNIPLPPTGTTISCKGWHQEAALRCLLNNLHPDVAEDEKTLLSMGEMEKLQEIPKPSGILFNLLKNSKTIKLF